MSTDSSRRALIIAISNYEDPQFRQLRSPGIDASELARVLSDPTIGGYTVETCLDPSERTVRVKLAGLLGDARPQDVILVHFSCHGITDAANRFFFAAADTQKARLSATAISGDWVAAEMADSACRQIVLLLDCCQSGAFPAGFVPRADDEVKVVQQLAARGRLVMTASSAREYSWEGDRLTGDPRPAIFTQAVVRGLETGEADLSNDGEISFDELYEYVHRQVTAVTPNQNPTKAGQMEGSLVVAWNRHRRLPGELALLVSSPHPLARLAAVDWLGRALGGEGALPVDAAHAALERLTADADAEVGRRAAARLAAPAEHSAESSIDAAPLKPRRTRRSSSTRAGAPQTIEGLISRLRDPDGRARYLSAAALREAPRSAATSALCAALADDDPAVRSMAGEALVAIGNSVIPPLIGLLQSRQPALAGGAAAATLARFGAAAVPRLMQVLVGGDEQAATFAADALAAIGYPAERALVSAIDDLDPTVYPIAAAVLARVGADTMDLLKLLTSSSAARRRLAADALAILASPRSTPGLLAALDDADADVRRAAAAALAAIGGPAVSGLAARMYHPSPGARQAATEALVQIGGVAVPALTRSLGDPDAEVVHHVRTSLRGIATPAALVALLEPATSG